jgi:shikimate dehydrogenase
VFARREVDVLGTSAKSLDQFTTDVVAGLTISTLPGGVIRERFETLEDAVVLDVAYDPWPSTLAQNWNAENRISGLQMLLWQALIQLRLFVNGDGTIKLDREDEVFQIMSSTVKPL